MLRWLTVSVLALILAACGGRSSAKRASPTPETYTLSVSITAPTCGGGYRIEGASAIVRSESGTVIASATSGLNEIPRPTPLPADEQAIYDQYLTDLGNRRGGAPYPTLPPDVLKDVGNRDRLDSARTCKTAFTTQVPRAQFYQMTVGTHGAPTYSFDQMVQMSWRLSLSLQ